MSDALYLLEGRVAVADRAVATAKRAVVSAAMSWRASGVYLTGPAVTECAECAGLLRAVADLAKAQSEQGDASLQLRAFEQRAMRGDS